LLPITPFSTIPAMPRDNSEAQGWNPKRTINRNFNHRQTAIYHHK
jgi:hypothetical protein